MTLLAELRRRNVIRLAGLYLVGAWLIAQVAGTVLPMFGAPGWLPRSVVILLAIGFVPALVFSWVFELTPEGIKRESQIDRSQSIVDQTARKLDIAVIVLLLAVGAMLIWSRRSPPEGPTAATPAAATAPVAASATAVASNATLGPDSVAVLPFTNRSAEPDTAYFVDGVHDDLLTQLARNPTLTVISRTSMMEYRNTTKNLRQIGRELGVATLLEGAVQRTGKRVRINAQLINAATDAHLWAETFDRELTPENVFEIQSEIAAAIAGALGKTLGSAAATAQAGSAPTRNAKAYDLYLRAKAISGKGGVGNIAKVIALYRQALVEDPQFALAMGELGLELTNSYWFGAQLVAERDEARQWIDRALAREPKQPRLRWIFAAHLYWGQLDYAGALEQLALAEKSLPGSADVFTLRGWILRRAGRAAESIEAFTTAAALDPRSDDLLSSLVDTYGLLGDIDAAKRWQKRLLAIAGLEADATLNYPRSLLRVLGVTQSYGSALAALPSSYRSDFEYDIFLLPFLQRDFKQAEQVIDSFPDELVEDTFLLVPKSLMRARLAHAQGQSVQARKFATQALTQLDKALVDTPDDYRALISKALTLAVLGRGGEARAFARQALGTRIASKDAYFRTELRSDELRVLAMVADSQELARALDDYLRLPMKAWHYDGLMLDPVFDPHRQHPALLAMAGSYSRDTAAKGAGP